MNIYTVSCVTWGDYPTPDTYYVVVVLAYDETEAQMMAVSDNHEIWTGGETKLLDIEKINRMKKPRVLA